MGCEVVGNSGLGDAGTHWTWGLRDMGMRGHRYAGSRGIIDKGVKTLGLEDVGLGNSKT